MDTTDPEIKFDDQGICNHCKKAELMLNEFPLNLNEEEKEIERIKLIKKIKDSGKGKAFDCVIGVSGGVDSSYIAYLVKKEGLNPIAVHLDNGWNTEASVHNIENLCKLLKIELYTHVINWEEFKNLEISFLKACTPDLEITSDHAIETVLLRIANKYNLEYIITGTNKNSESILPVAWSHGHKDWKYIRSVYKMFSNKKLKTFPHRSLLQIFFYRFIKKIKSVSLLDFIDYNKFEAKKYLIENLNWKDYGGKHYESFITKFWQGYILPEKFNFDKRKAHLSSLVIAGQIKREDALKELENPPYPPEDIEHDKEYFCEKIEISMNEFDDYMNKPTKSFFDYPSYENSWYFHILLPLWKKITR